MHNTINNPPAKIDGAEVLEWARSGEKPFGLIPVTSGKTIEIYGLAICKYPGSEIIYRFSCNANWDVEQDSYYQSVDEAKDNLPQQYCNVDVVWNIYQQV